MKNYTITVNGNVYDVVVEEGASGSAPAAAEEKTEFIAKKEKEYRDKFANPYDSAKYGYIDDVIEPRNTRFRVIRALQALETKKDVNPPKKHCNIPL